MSSNNRISTILRPNYDELRYLPMLVGAISPISIIMSLPPITGSWKRGSGEGSLKADRNLPATIVLSLAVIFLLVANSCLLFRFMEKRIVLNTWLAIILFILHALFMFVPMIHFVAQEGNLSSKTYSGDFFAGIAVSILSLFLASLLIIDYYKHDKLRFKGSGISNKQRNLVFFSIGVTLWSSIGALVFSHYENWSFTRGVYFTLVTMTTIGFGDYSPSLTGTRTFLFFYAIIGIVAMGILINSIRVVILESFESKYFSKIDELGVTELERFFTQEKDVEVSSTQPLKSAQKSRLERMLDEKAAMLSRQLRFSCLSLLVFWFVGAVLFMLVEDWTYFDALYFCFVSFTTIGYGDITLKTFPGIVCFIGYSLLGLVAAAYVISIATEMWSLVLERRANKIDRKHHKKVHGVVNKEEDSHDGFDQLVLTLEALDHSSGNQETDLLFRLVGVARLYHSQIGYHINDCEDILSPELLDSPQFRKVERYHDLFGKLLDQSQGALALKATNMSSNVPQQHILSSSGPQMSSNSETIELLDLKNA